ncbi:hypothetical protein BAUCODRAFT_123932 [Baudoinia panamericana UAMH 10762]|uniref:Uncharacterized protein n=1 Tax=Baudoinia panamericana (strain UAMH 10762) TaxID=717646 RepID=M2N8V6_BAUPA|nr:uncharacterized protein BAUCODRAFT_123932 [Baudoinia panamericana UAMH 10762]EMC95504.1 hypothetical protein BAUCODRAFT_123932 [Baudoinia panamericana UAMH 10762]
MPYVLRGRRVLITGGSKGLGAAIANAFAREGASIALNYVADARAAQDFAVDLTKRHGIKAVAIQAVGDVVDICSDTDIERLVATATVELGGIDVVIANAAWTEFSAFDDLRALSDEKWNKCWSANVMSSLRLFREAQPHLTATPEGGVYLYTASTAGVSVSGSSMAYSVTKAAGLQLVKCLAQTDGRIRTNAVLPGLLLTEWGKRYSPEFVQKWQADNPLQRVPEPEECADIFVALAKNLSMTGQQIPIECGWLLTHSH